MVKLEGIKSTKDCRTNKKETGEEGLKKNT
jgi:hypothetical protein